MEISAKLLRLQTTLNRIPIVVIVNFFLQPSFTAFETNNSIEDVDGEYKKVCLE
jgi:hypothetical protein